MLNSGARIKGWALWGWAPDYTTFCVTLSQVLKLSEPVSSSGEREVALSRGILLRKSDTD